jgi:periplasmic divalent cation tolerance protein
MVNNTSIIGEKMMSNFIEIQWTCGSIDEARKISRFLIQERYAACAQIIPWIESIYIWNNQLETTQETKVILKTKLDFYDSIKEIILKNCNYQVPEILFRSIDGGNEEYLKWLEESVSKQTVHN